MKWLADELRTMGRQMLPADGDLLRMAADLLERAEAREQQAFEAGIKARAFRELPGADGFRSWTWQFDRDVSESDIDEAYAAYKKAQEETTR
jgi:hypothetical protein